MSAEDLVSRRSFVAGGFGTAALAGVAAPALLPWALRHVDLVAFEHGVASGDPLPTSVVLWTRVTPEPRATAGSGRGEDVVVEWSVATDPHLENVVAHGSVTTGADRDHTVKVDAGSLEPSTQYWYQFTWDGHESPIGRTRTAPAPEEDPGQLTWGVVSCANWQAGWFSAYRHLAQRGDIDLIVHLGDYLYEYQPGKYAFGHLDQTIRPHDPPRETVTLSDYRRRHAQYKTDPDLQRLHAQVPFIVTWDDHEVADNWWTDGALEHQGYEGSFADRKTAAQQAYDEWMPVRLAGTAEPGDGTRIYRNLQFGTLAELSMLDLRSFRANRLSPGDPGTDPHRTMTGQNQRRWLLDRLDSTAVQWKLIGNPVLVSSVLMPPRPQAELFALQKLTGNAPLGPAVTNPDGWAAFRGDQSTLFGHLRENAIDDVVFLTGDVHTSWAVDVTGSDGSPLATEFVVPSVTSNNAKDFMGTAPRTASVSLEAAVQNVNPAVKWVNLDDHGYGVFTVTSQRAQMEWWAISDRSDPQASVARIASWEIRAGERGVRASE